MHSAQASTARSILVTKKEDIRWVYTNVARNHFRNINRVQVQVLRDNLLPFDALYHNQG